MDAIMKKFILAIGVISTATLLSSCTVTSAPYTPAYNGYTVGYGYDDGVGSYGTGTYGYDSYVGYGGWASNYYSPGYRYNTTPRTYYYGGRGIYRSGVGYAGRGWRR